MKTSTKYILGILVVVAIFVLAIIVNPNAGFGGTDDLITSIIQSINPNYRSWFTSIFEPSPEMETLLFSLVAAAGAFVIGYFLGYMRARSKKQKEKD
jgi:cobalt/nickel transport protein